MGDCILLHKSPGMKKMTLARIRALQRDFDVLEVGAQAHNLTELTMPAPNCHLGFGGGTS